VVRGDASPEEIAALVAVLMVSGQAGDGAPDVPARSEWSGRPALRRVSLQPAGPGSWRRSGLPG
jgi:Acyl-CoA carboxylase epsilon subunit